MQDDSTLQFDARLDQRAKQSPGPEGWLVALAAAAFFITFVLPFFFPGNHPVYSATYPAGAENRAATLGLAALSLLVLGWAARGAVAAAKTPGSLISRRAMWVGAALVALWTAALGVLIAHAGIRFGESAYFLERMRDVAGYGSRIYTDIEFPYGPLLLLPPVWLARLGLPLVTANFAWLTGLNVAGVLMTGYCLNRLPLVGSRLRLLLFALFCFEQMHPLAGSNYSLGKFMLPFAALLWGTSLATDARRLAGLAAGCFVTVMVSPELGVGLAAGIGAWALWTAWAERRPVALVACLAPVLGYAAFFALYGRGFLERLGHAAGGALNLILEPLPHVLVLVAAVVWLAPRAVGSALGVREADAGKLAGVYALSLGLLPGALGRSDPLHVFFNGFGFLLLAFVAVGRMPRRWSLAWTAAFVLLCVQVQVTNFVIYRPALAALLRHAQPPFDIDRLRAETGGAPIATPALMSLSLADELALRADGQFVEDRAPGLSEVWTPADESAKVARLRLSTWALLPADGFLMAEGSPNTSTVKRMLRLGYRYPQRREPYVIGKLLEAELGAHWVVADRLGDAVLYRRVQ